MTAPVDLPGALERLGGLASAAPEILAGPVHISRLHIRHLRRDAGHRGDGALGDGRCGDQRLQGRISYHSDSAHWQGTATAGLVGTLEAAVEMNDGLAMLCGSEALVRLRAL